MYAFILTIILFFSLVVNGFDSSIKPALTKISTNGIIIPAKLITFWLIVTQVLFPMNSVLAARKSDFALVESLPFMATILGIILGLVAEAN